MFCWCWVKILKMKFDQDLCLNMQYDFGKMNSTLGSVVPLAMFYTWYTGRRMGSWGLVLGRWRYSGELYDWRFPTSQQPAAPRIGSTMQHLHLCPLLWRLCGLLWPKLLRLPLWKRGWPHTKRVCPSCPHGQVPRSWPDCWDFCLPDLRPLRDGLPQWEDWVRNKKVGKALNKLDSRWSWSNKLGDFKNGAEFWDQFCREYSTIAKTTLLEAASKCDDVYTLEDLKKIKFIGARVDAAWCLSSQVLGKWRNTGINMVELFEQSWK